MKIDIINPKKHFGLFFVQIVLLIYGGLSILQSSHFLLTNLSDITSGYFILTLVFGLLIDIMILWAGLSLGGKNILALLIAFIIFSINVFGRIYMLDGFVVAYILLIVDVISALILFMYIIEWMLTPQTTND